MKLSIPKTSSIVILFCLLLLLPLLPLLTQGLPITHDGQDHVVRIANFYQSFTEGNLFPRWGSNLNWGFGHPVLMFLYPLPSYTASLFHSMGFGLIDSTKLVFAVSFILSGLACFWFAKEQWGIFPGMMAGLLYTFAPYRFIDLSVRGALGEHVSFVFLPLILLGIKKVAVAKHTVRWSIFLCFSVVGLLLSHNAVSIMMIPIAVCYFIFEYIYEARQRKNFLLYSIYAVVLALALSAFFLFPAFFEGKYTLRDIVTKNEVLTRMVPFTDFFYSPWNFGGGTEFSKEIGILQWIVVIAACITVFRVKKREEKILGLGLIILFFISLIAMTSFSLPLWKALPILQKFQFPWRILTISVLLSSLLGGYVVSYVKVKTQYLIVIASSVFLLLSTFHMWSPKAFIKYEDSFFTGIYKGTTDTGESSPIWSVRFMEYQPAQPLEFIEGTGTVEEIERTSTTRRYTITSDSPARVVENTLYFPGWNVFANDRQLPVEFQDPQWRGRMTFFIEPGVHNVLVVFKETKLRMVSNMITVLGIGILIVSCMAALYTKKK